MDYYKFDYYLFRNQLLYLGFVGRFNYHLVYIDMAWFTYCVSAGASDIIGFDYGFFPSVVLLSE